MGAGHHSRARRLSFLAVVFLFGVVMLAQANVKNASIAQIRLHEMSWPSVRLERENPCRQGVSFESQARLSLEMPIGIFCGGDPVNYFDPDGRCANPVSTTGVVGAAGVLEQAAQVRYDYNAWVAQYVTDNGGYSPTRDAIRDYFNQPETSTALSRASGDLYRWEQSVSGVEPSLANATSTAAAVNNAAAMARYGGQGLIVLGAGMSVYTVATAPDPYLAMTQQGAATVGGVGGATAGAWAGAGIGAAIGSVVPVAGTAIGGAVGAVVGAIGGGIGGGMAGHALGTAAYNANYGPNSPWYP